MIDKIYSSVFLTMLIVIFPIDIYILVKIFKIQKSNHNCQCAKNSYVSKILTSVIIMGILLLFIILLVTMGNIDRLYNDIIPSLFFIAMIILFIIGPYSSAMMFKMSKQIEKDKCDCFDSTLKNMLKYYSILRLIPIIITVMFWIYFLWKGEF